MVFRTTVLLCIIILYASCTTLGRVAAGGAELEHSAGIGKLQEQNRVLRDNADKLTEDIERAIEGARGAKSDIDRAIQLFAAYDAAVKRFIARSKQAQVQE